MDIAGLSISMNQSKVQQAAELAVMKMAMNKVSENGNGITEMLKNAVDPNLGTHLYRRA